MVDLIRIKGPASASGASGSSPNSLAYLFSMLMC